MIFIIGTSNTKLSTGKTYETVLCLCFYWKYCSYLSSYLCAFKFPHTFQHFFSLELVFAITQNILPNLFLNSGGTLANINHEFKLCRMKTWKVKLNILVHFPGKIIKFKRFFLILRRDLTSCWIVELLEHFIRKLLQEF